MTASACPFARSATKKANSVKILQSKFVRSVLVVGTGAAGAQALNMAAAPFITRLYGPEAFGVFGTFTASLNIIVPLGALSYPLAIVLPKSDTSAVGLAKLSFMIAAIATAALTLVLYLFKDEVVRAFSLQTIEPYILLLPVAMLLYVSMTVFTYWAIRKKLFSVSARVAVLQSLWLNLTKVALGFWIPVAGTLVVLASISGGIHAVMLVFGIRKAQRGGGTNGAAAVSAGPPIRHSVSDYQSLASAYRDFPFYRTPQILLNSVSESLPVLMLAALFGAAAAGFYSIARLALAVPANLIGQSVASVFYPHFNDAHHAKEQTYPLLAKATVALGLIGLLPFGLVIALGPWLFTLVFGADWELAGKYAQLLSLWLFFAFAARPAITALPVLELQATFLRYEIVSLALRVAALLAGYYVFNDSLIAIGLFSIVSVFVYTALILVALIAAARYDDG